MSKAIRKKQENRGPTKKAIYNEFILWSAMPMLEQRQLGIETQTAFAEYHKVSKDTLTEWKKRPDFETRVDKILHVWSIGKTPDVVHGIYRAAVKGNPMSQLLWLQYFKKFSPKTEVDHTVKVEISVNDIRFLIEGLPEYLKIKHYANLRELLDDAHAVRNAGEIEEGDWNERPPDPILIEADNDASDVSGEDADELAESNPPGIRADMVGDLLAYHHQGAERRW